MTTTQLLFRDLAVGEEFKFSGGIVPLGLLIGRCKKVAHDRYAIAGNDVPFAYKVGNDEAPVERS